MTVQAYYELSMHGYEEILFVFGDSKNYDKLSRRRFNDLSLHKLLELIIDLLNNVDIERMDVKDVYDTLRATHKRL